MGSNLVQGYLKIADGLFSPTESKTRDILVSLTDDFTRTQTQIPPEPAAPSNDTYSIFAGSKALGLLGMHHMFVRLEDSDRKVLADIHGIRLPNGSKTAPLEAMLEPGDFEYFSKMQGGANIPVWHGNAADAGIKMQRAVQLIERTNAEHYPYHLLSESCNTLFRSILDVMDVPMPKHLPFWQPGIQNEFKSDVAAVRALPVADGASWIAQFKSGLNDERTKIDTSLAALHHAPSISV